MKAKVLLIFQEAGFVQRKKEVLSESQILMLELRRLDKHYVS